MSCCDKNALIAADRPRALDLFCCAGGAGMGLHRAGYDVTGVDVAAQPDYPFRFYQGNALDASLDGFDLVWASPPCQAHSSLKHRTGKPYECFIERIRAKLHAWGGHYIIENVMGAPLLNPVMLCGSAFGLGVRRHRIFESNVPLIGTECKHWLQPEPIDVSGTGARRVHAIRKDGKGGNSRKPRDLEEARAAMGIDWTDRKHLSQAIPPDYAEYLGHQTLRALLDQTQRHDPMSEPETIQCNWCGRARKPSAYAGDDHFQGLRDICQLCRGVETKRYGKARTSLR